jgi:hypothetical protein
MNAGEGRVNVHIKPLIGSQSVKGLTLADVEKLQAEIATGRATACASSGCKSVISDIAEDSANPTILVDVR